jgi:hypothetical protein
MPGLCLGAFFIQIELSMLQETTTALKEMKMKAEGYHSIMRDGNEDKRPSCCNSGTKGFPTI